MAGKLLKQLWDGHRCWSTSLKRGVNEMGRQGTCALFLITVFICSVVVVVLFLALKHFHAHKYKEGVGQRLSYRKSTD
jgi:hypothetical protein